MEVYLDFENTLLNDQNLLNKKDKIKLNALAQKYQITILTQSTLSEVDQILQNKDIKIVSVLENKMKYKNKEFTHFLPLEQCNKILKNPFLYTAYTIDQITLIYRYQYRLRFFYPNHTFKLISHLKQPVSFLWVSIYNEGLKELYKQGQGLFIEVLFQDATKTTVKITADPSTKKDWLLKIKKSPAIAIGDSISDYEFMKYCEIPVAMKNADQDLKEQCPYQTQLTNAQAGAIQFLIDYLKRQPS